MELESQPPPTGGADRGAVRAPALVVVGGLGAALVSLPLAAIAGDPYLSARRVNPWVVVFAIGLFAALFAAPFAIERLLRPVIADADRRWDRSLLIWGGVAAAVGAVAVLVGLAGGFSTSSLAGTVGLLAAAESIMVIGTLAVLLLSG